MKISKKYIINLLVAVIFSACGGKDGALEEQFNKNNNDGKYQIIALDGYIKDANISDSDGNIAKYDSKNKKGIYYFDKEPIGTIKLIGGVIESSGLKFDINLTSDYSSTKVISPITTFIEGNYILSDKYKGILGVDNLDIDYISSNDLNVTKLSQLFYILLRENSLGNSHKEYIKTHDIATFDEVYESIKSDINSSSLTNKQSLQFLVDKIKQYDGNSSEIEDYLFDFKDNISKTYTQKKIFKTDINVSLNDFDDGYYHKGIEHNFTRDDTNEIVKDNMLNLEWEDKANTLKYNQNEAQIQCESLDLNGTGWRVPSIDELQTIRDINSTFPAINSKFTHHIDDVYLSNSREQKEQIQINFWAINFGSGIEVLSDYFTTNYLRCVRGEKYSNSINSTIKDTNSSMTYDMSTKLIWQDSDDNIKLTKNYYDSLIYCDGLSLNSYEDWRVPNINELNSIYDKNSTKSAFSNISTNSYWSSSTYQANSLQAWVILNNKASNTDDKNSFNSVRCVRDMQ